MTTSISATRTWAIVLAGGEGTRLSRLTEAIHGSPVPKQFATLVDGESPLQATVRRLEHLVPGERIVVVVGRNHLPWVRIQLRAHASVTVLVQPASLGTATAILYALRWIRLQDPEAQVLVSPSDHHVDRLPPLLAAIDAAIESSRALGRVVLLGVAPDGPDPDYGWVVTGARHQLATPVQRVERFVEKPGPEVAVRLFELGALWNTFIFTAPAAVLAGLARTYLPDHMRRFEELDRFSFAPGNPDLDVVFGALAAADYSKEVLQVATELSVLAMRDTGWSDWGTPARVLASLRGTTREATLRKNLDESHDRARRMQGA